MTVSDIKAFVLAVDPNAQHYESAEKSEAYTVWREIRPLPIMADDTHIEAWAFQIDRFTKSEDDAIAKAMRTALEHQENISYDLVIDYEQDTGYIHYVFDCEGV